MADMGDTKWHEWLGRMRRRVVPMACATVGLGISCSLPCVASGAEGTPAGMTTTGNEQTGTGSLRVTVGIANGTAKAKEANRFGVTLELSGETDEAERAMRASRESMTVCVNGIRQGKPHADGNERMTFDLADGDEVLVEGIPAGTRYVVTEDSPSWFDQLPSNALGEIGQGQVAEASFENDYVIEGKARVEATLDVLGDEDAMDRILDGTMFRLTDEEGNLVATAKSDPDGNIRFPEMAFGANADGRAYRYVVTEDIGEQEGVAHDETEFPVVIMAEDVEGRGVMDVGVAYTPASGIVFRNLVSIDMSEEEPERAGSGTALLALVSMGVITVLLVDMARTRMRPRD